MERGVRRNHFNRAVLILFCISILIYITPRQITDKIKLYLVTPLIFPHKLSNVIMQIVRPPETPHHCQLREENLYLRNLVVSLEAENNNLKEALNTVDKISITNAEKKFNCVVADVLIPRECSLWNQNTLIINRGSGSGIKEGLPVIWQNCLIGFVSQTSIFTSKIELLTSENTRLAIIATSSDGKNKLLTVAEGKKENLRLKWIRNDQEVAVQKGWLVFTASDDARYLPQWLSIGIVDDVIDGGDKFLDVIVKPLVKPQTLQRVIVLLPQ